MDSTINPAGVFGSTTAPAPAPAPDVPAAAAPALNKVLEPNVFKYFNTTPKDAQTWSQLLAVGAYTFIGRIISWLDNVFLTPFRIYLFIAAALAGSVTGIIALSPLMGILGLALPLVILTVIGLAYTFYGRHKGTTLKERDLINILHERYPGQSVEIETIKLGKVQLIASQILIKKEKAYFSAIYYRGKKVTQRTEAIPDERYVTEIQLIDTDEALYADGRIAIPPAIQKNILERGILEAPSPIEGKTKFAWFFLYYIQPWLDFKWRSETFKARFEFLKEHLMYPLFSVAFNAAMGYWTIWSIAAFTGHLATTSSLPFATPFILIVPLVVGIIYVAAQIISSYRTSRVKSSDEATKLVSMVAKMTSAQREADNALASVEGPDRAAIKLDAATRIQRAVDGSSMLPKYSPSIASRIYGFFFGGNGSQSLPRVANFTIAGLRFRIGLNLLVRFAMGLILTFIALWPLVDLLTQVVAITASPVYLAWLSVAAFMGLCYLVYGTAQRSKDETKRYEAVTNYKKEGEFKRLVALQALLDSIRAANKVQRRLSTEAQKAPGQASADVIGPDSPEFAEKMNIVEKTWRKYLWLLLKQAARRFNTWIGSAGSAVFLIRLVFIAGSVVCGMLSIPEMTVIATGTFVAIGVFAALWSLIRLGFLLYERDERFVKLLIEENASYEVIMKQAITLGLVENYKLGGSLVRTTKTAPPEAVLPTKALPALVALTPSSIELASASESSALVTAGTTAALRKPAQVQSSVSGGWWSFFASWFYGQQLQASERAAAAVAAGERVEAETETETETGALLPPSSSLTGTA